jgi:hypothetical protein
MTLRGRGIEGTAQEGQDGWLVWLMMPEFCGPELLGVSLRTHAHWRFMIDFISYNHFAPVWSVQMTRSSHRVVALGSRWTL